MESFFNKKIQTAEILTVGTEILMGQIANTNALYLARQLRDLGINSYYQTTCGDNPERLIDAIRTAAKRSDCVLLSGGLGPTEDDITMACAAKAAGIPLVFNEGVFRQISAYFHSMGRSLSPNNRKQALLPQDCLTLENANGTAPGAAFPCEVEGNISLLILLPGPPNENRPMFERSVRPLLQSCSPFKLRSYFIRMIGIGESAAEEKLRDLIDGQHNPTLASYCGTGEVMFRLTQQFHGPDEADTCLPVLTEIKARLGDYIYEIGDRTMPEVVRDLCLERSVTLGLAESCTGGRAAAALTALPGASDFFIGSIVSYANQAKEICLGVPVSLIDTDGAVSEACAKAMACGVRERLGCDYACSVTGLAGPGGEKNGLPIGTIYLAVAGPTGCRAEKRFFHGQRGKIQDLATLSALDFLRRILLEHC